MKKAVRQLVVGFLNNRRKRAKAYCVRGIGAAGGLTKAEIQEHTATGDAPALYVGTYGKYNDGNLYGQWIDIASFDDYDEFRDYLYRLHADERDPEFMAQDFENFPEQWYSESGFLNEEWFNRVKEYAEISEREAADAYIDMTGEWDESDFEDRYEGKYDSEEDFAYWIVDEIGIENIQNKDAYFDYDAFARDLFMTDYTFMDGYVFRAY